MRVLVAGATGVVGRRVVEQALARGHAVVAVARSADRLTIDDPNLEKVPADILDPHKINPLLKNVDAVVSVVGIGTSRTPTALYSEGTKNLVCAMGAHGVERIVALSAEPAEHWAHRGLLKQLVVFPLLQTFFGASYDDMRRMDIVLWESHVRWTTIRAPRIRDVHAKGHYRISADGPLKAGWAVTATDLASALLDLIEKDRFIRSPTFIAN